MASNVPILNVSVTMAGCPSLHSFSGALGVYSTAQNQIVGLELVPSLCQMPMFCQPLHGYIQWRILARGEMIAFYTSSSYKMG